MIFTRPAANRFSNVYGFFNPCYSLPFPSLPPRPQPPFTSLRFTSLSSFSHLPTAPPSPSPLSPTHSMHFGSCVAALLLGVAVLLSALFWLPPVAARVMRAEGPDPGDDLGGERACRHCEISVCFRISSLCLVRTGRSLVSSGSGFTH
jgi:hypothetical protein